MQPEGSKEGQAKVAGRVAVSGQLPSDQPKPSLSLQGGRVSRWRYPGKESPLPLAEEASGPHGFVKGVAVLLSPPLLRFPADYPPDCPISGAHPVTWSVWYLVDQSPPSADDFRPLAVKEGRANYERRNNRQKCMARGISVWTDRSAVLVAQSLNPGLAGKLLARGTIKPTDGWVAQTGGNPAHHTWWPFEGVSPHTIFQVEGR